MIYLFISIVVLFVSWYLFKLVAGSMRLTQLNLINFIYYYQLVLQCFVGSILIVNNWNSDHPTSALSDISAFYGWLSVQYTMIALPLGMLVALRLFGYHSNDELFTNYITSSEKLVANDSQVMVWPLYILSLVSLLAVIYTYVMLETIPIAVAWQSKDALTNSLLRAEAGYYFEGSTTVKNYFGIILTPLLSYIAFIYWKTYRKSNYFIWFMVMFAGTFAILLYNLQKAPFLKYLLGFLFIYILMNGKVKKITLSYFVVMMFVLINVTYAVIAPSNDFVFQVKVILYRIIFGQVSGLYFGYEFFPGVFSHLGFSSFLPFYRSLLGLPVSESASRLIIMAYDHKAFQNGLSGVMNSLFLSEAWANFGMIGVVIAPFWVGIYIQTLYMLFLKARKTPLMLGSLAYFSQKLTINNGFNEFIISEPVIFVFLIIWIVLLSVTAIRKPQITPSY